MQAGTRLYIHTRQDATANLRLRLECINSTTRYSIPQLPGLVNRTRGYEYLSPILAITTRVRYRSVPVQDYTGQLDIYKLQGTTATEKQTWGTSVITSKLKQGKYVTIYIVARHGMWCHYKCDTSKYQLIYIKFIFNYNYIISSVHVKLLMHSSLSLKLAVASCLVCTCVHV